MVRILGTRPYIRYDDAASVTKERAMEMGTPWQPLEVNVREMVETICSQHLLACLTVGYICRDDDDDGDDGPK